MRIIAFITDTGGAVHERAISRFTPRMCRWSVEKYDATNPIATKAAISSLRLVHANTISLGSHGEFRLFKAHG